MPLSLDRVTEPLPSVGSVKSGALSPTLRLMSLSPAVDRLPMIARGAGPAGDQPIVPCAHAPQAAVISASSRAKSIAPAQRARCAPAASSSASPPGTPSNNSCSGATGAQQRLASSRWPPRRQDAGRAERGQRGGRCRGAASPDAPAASRSIRYWTMNSMIDQPAARVAQIPRRVGRGLLLRPCAGASRRRRRAASRDRAARSAAVCIAVSTRRHSAGSPAIGRARVSAICSQVQAIRADSGESRRGWRRSARIRPTGRSRMSTS